MPEWYTIYAIELLLRLPITISKGILLSIKIDALVYITHQPLHQGVICENCTISSCYFYNIFVVAIAVFMCTNRNFIRNKTEETQLIC